MQTPLVKLFKDALLKAIDDFSKKEGKLTTTLAEAIIELKYLIEAKDSAVHLRQEIMLELRKTPIKTFAFLPFVNDLVKSINKVLADPIFAENQLLIYGYGDLYSENKKLQKENEFIRQQFEEFKKSGMPKELADTIQKLSDENVRLVGELSQLDQKIVVITTEKEILEASIVTLNQTKASLQHQLDDTLEEKEQLAKEHLQELEENRKLKEENAQLKSLVEAYKQNKENNASEQKTAKRQSSFSFGFK